MPKWKTIVKVVLPDRVHRPDHRRRARHRPRRRRDRAAADPGRLLGDTNTQPVQRVPGARCPTFINDQFININTSPAPAPYHLDANGNRVAGAVANYAPDRLWGAALTLIIIVMALNLIARLVGRRNKVAS